jgi:hypothetical protein
MKIDKVVFSCSETFSPFWNIQSKVWKTKFGVEPVCLLFGDKKSCKVSEEYGEVIEQKYDPDLPQIIQIQFSKFYHPKVEPETTWIIGDIDQIPLQTEYFLNDLPNVPDDAYAHLNYTLTAQMRPGIRPDGMPGISPDTFLKVGAYVNGGYDLPGHYHVAKGKLYENLFFRDKSFKEVVQGVIDARRHGMVTEDARNTLNKSIHGDYWVAEEGYTSEQIWYGLKSKRITGGFFGKEYHIFDGKIDRVGNGTWFDPNGWTETDIKNMAESNKTTPENIVQYLKQNNIKKRSMQWTGKEYLYDVEKLKNKGYMDIHCYRPYHEQEGPMMRILEIAGMI